MNLCLKPSLLRTALLVAALATTAGNVSSQSLPNGEASWYINDAAAEPYAEQISEYREYVQSFRRENRVLSFSLALMKDGELIMLEQLGYQDHDAEEPTVPETSYLVASITKTFTAATLLAMEAEGHIDLDVDFTTLSDWDGRCEWLTGSGIIMGGGVMEDGRIIEAPRCDAEISLRNVLQNRVQGTPGTSFFYNPVVFGRLSNWVEENTDRSWRDWMRHYVFEPAGLEHAAAGWRDHKGATALTNLAPPFRRDDGDSDGISPSPLPNPELNASSGVIASVLDLAQYSRALDDGRILSPELRETMWTPALEPSGQPAAYAHGWFVQSWQNHRLVWHSGWWPDAYAGVFLKAPEDGWTLIALGNTDGIRHEIDTLTKAQIEKNPLVGKFLELFVESE